MKSKLTTYLLIIAVLVLWGIIAKKVFFSGNDPKPAAKPKTASENVVKEEEKLALDYRDPFREKPAAKVTAAGVPPPVQDNREKFDIKYIGRLKSGKTTNYIVEAGGNIETLSLNEELNGFRLTRAAADSLYFKKNGYTYTLPVE